MKDMDVKELLALAAGGLVVPGDPVVDDILERAARVRRRRRLAVAACSAAAVVAVGVGTAFLPQPGAGASNPNRAATAPPTAPSGTPEPSPPGSADPTTPDPGGMAVGGLPTTGTTAPSPSAARTSTASTSQSAGSSPRTSAPSTKSSTTGSSSPRTSTSGASTGTATAPADAALAKVKSMLPAGIGDIRRKPETGDAPPNPLSGRYLISKDGRMGYVSMEVFDPKVNPGQPRMTVAEARVYDNCGDIGEGPRATDCRQYDLPGGGLLKTWRSPGNRGQHPQPQGPRYLAEIWHADGRGMFMQVSAGFDNTPGYLPAMEQPPFSAEQLEALVRNLGWYRT